MQKFNSKIIKAVFVAVFSFELAACATKHNTVNTWDDANIIASQRAEIERLNSLIADLRTQLGNAQQITQSSIESIDRAYARLESGIARTKGLQDTIDLLTEFARQCLEEINRLREHESKDI